MSYWSLIADTALVFFAPLNGDLLDAGPNGLDGSWAAAGQAAAAYEDDGSGNALKIETGYGAGSNFSGGGASFPAAAGGSANARTMLWQMKPAHNLASFARTVYQDNGSTQRQWRNSRHTNARHYGIAFSDALAIGTEISAADAGSGAWSSIARVIGGSVNKSRINGTNTTGAALTTLFDANFSLFVGGRAATNDGQPGLYRCVAVFGRHLSDAEIDAAHTEFLAGPEPTNTVLPTFNATTGAWTVGTWDSYGNGTLRYAVELYDSADDSLVAILQLPTTTTSGNCLADLVTAGPGFYYLRIYAENNGGTTGLDSATVEFTGVSNARRYATPDLRHNLNHSLSL